MRRTQIFFITFGMANLGLILYGMITLANPGILLESFSMRIFQFPENATAAVGYLTGLFRLLGFFNLVLGLVGLVLLWRYRVSQQTWIAFRVIGFSILSYLGPISFDNTVGEIGFFEIIEHIVFVAMVLSGMIMLNDMRKTSQA